MALTFSITEALNGKSFIFKDLTYWDNLTPGTDDVTSMTLTITLPNEDEVEYEISDSGYEEEMEIEVAEEDFNLSVFPDGTYKFVLEVTTTSPDPDDEIESDPHYFGFAAIISEQVMKASLAFTPFETKKKREWVLELQRLLNNLRYSAYTGNFNFFDDNLAQLQKII